MKLVCLNPYWLTVEHTGGRVHNYARPDGEYFGGERRSGHYVDPSPYNFGQPIWTTSARHQPSCAYLGPYGFGIGVDAGLYIAHRYDENETEPIAAPKGYRWSFLFADAAAGWIFLSSAHGSVEGSVTNMKKSLSVAKHGHGLHPAAMLAKPRDPHRVGVFLHKV